MFRRSIAKPSDWVDPAMEFSTAVPTSTMK
jgi:hypothetical protein